jgi:hypothetical protein
MQLAKFTLSLLLGSLLLTSARANDFENKISTKVLEGESKNTLVRVFKAQANEKSVIRIWDMQGYILHREEIQGTTAKKFNLSKLPEGKYIMEVRTDGKKTKEVFYVEEDSKTATYFRPALRMKQEQVDVLFQNPITSKLTLRIYTEHGRVLYEEEVAAQQEYAKTINTSKLKRGNYTLSIVGKGCAYTKNLKIK